MPFFAPLEQSCLAYCFPFPIAPTSADRRLDIFLAGEPFRCWFHLARIPPPPAYSSKQLSPFSLPLSPRRGPKKSPPIGETLFLYFPEYLFLCAGVEGRPSFESWKWIGIPSPLCMVWNPFLPPPRREPSSRAEGKRLFSPVEEESFFFFLGEENLPSTRKQGVSLSHSLAPYLPFIFPPPQMRGSSSFPPPTARPQALFSFCGNSDEMPFLFPPSFYPNSRPPLAPLSAKVKGIESKRSCRPFPFFAPKTQGPFIPFTFPQMTEISLRYACGWMRSFFFFFLERIIVPSFGLELSAFFFSKYLVESPSFFPRVSNSFLPFSPRLRDAPFLLRT